MATLYFQLLGTRGSRPILDRHFVKFGGNTTSYKVWADGMFPVYVDGGSGLFREGHRIDPGVNQFTFLLTHSHWDHILAFPFFEPFYRPITSARFWGTPSFKETFEELFQHQFQTDAFPVNYSELPADISFTTIEGKQSFIIPPPPQHTQDGQKDRYTGHYTVSTYQINHPGVDLGYRISYNNTSIVILTDLAPITNNHLGHGMSHFTKRDEEAYYEGLVEFCWDADVLLYDTHFNEENIKGRESWGHSTEMMAVDVAIKSQAKRLILGHHAPEDHDQAILKKLDSARHYAGSHPLKVLVPQEDDILEI